MLTQFHSRSRNMGIKRGHDESEVETPGKSDITEDEAALYDRQIRLWGVESQKRLRSTSLLLIGMGGLGAEIAKNIVLAGVKSITLLDDKKIEPSDFISQFLLHGVEVGKNRAEESKARVTELNPNVDVISETGSVSEKDAAYFTQFNVICATDCSTEDLLKLDKLCREHKILFFCGDAWGYHGYCFVDVGLFKYLPVKKGKEPALKKKKTDPAFLTAKFGSLERALSFKSGKTGVGLPKRISKVFFLVHILMKFREMHKRLPSPQHYKEDMESLTTLRKTVMKRLGFDEEKVSNEDLRNVFGELSPVCAVMGGILAQEMIKAICADQLPIQNFLLFDGDISQATVENLG